MEVRAVPVYRQVSAWARGPNLSRVTLARLGRAWVINLGISANSPPLGGANTRDPRRLTGGSVIAEGDPRGQHPPEHDEHPRREHHGNER